MGEQGHDDHHGLCRGAQPIEDGTFAGAEGFVTRVTDEPLFLLRMDTDIALARLASGRTVPIGAECGCGVHDGPPGVVWKHAKRSIFGPPFSLQVRFTTVKCRATGLSSSASYLVFTTTAETKASIFYDALSHEARGPSLRVRSGAAPRRAAVGSQRHALVRHGHPTSPGFGFPRPISHHPSAVPHDFLCNGCQYSLHEATEGSNDLGNSVTQLLLW